MAIIGIALLGFLLLAFVGNKNPSKRRLASSPGRNWQPDMRGAVWSSAHGGWVMPAKPPVVYRQLGH